MRGLLDIPQSTLPVGVRLYGSVVDTVVRGCLGERGLYVRDWDASVRIGSVLTLEIDQD